MQFLKENKRFSFYLGGKSVWEQAYEKEEEQEENTLTTKYFFKNGLVVTNVAKKYDAYGAYEWVNYFENTSNTPTEIISDIWDCNIEFPFEFEENRKKQAYLPDENHCTKVYAPVGSTWDKYEFYCNVDEIHCNRYPNYLFPGETKKYATSGGRSSEARAPFFNVYKNGAGFIAAVGWSGQWNAEVTRTNDSVIFKSKIEDTHFKLLGGEKIRTSSIVIMPYSTKTDSWNLWRRLLKNEFSPIGKGKRDKQLPLCAGIWGGMSSKSVLERVEKIRKNHLPYECVWMDAGWYGEDTRPTPDEYEGDWSMHTGDWRVSELCHPNKLEDVSAAIHEAGMKFLLWFEPERVIPSVPIVKEHPEYFLRTTDGKNAAGNYLLDLGNDEAWNYCYATIASLVERLHIDCYRQDFNFAPLGYWRANDDEDRQGISEIKYIMGLYRLWDALIQRFPALLIDDCASGGRRIDIEMLKRSVPLWRSDLYCPANCDVEGTQMHTQTFNLWMPYSGMSGARIYDEYRIRSAYASGMITQYAWSEKEGCCDTTEKIEFIKKYMTEYLKVRPYFSEDFYALTEVSNTKDIWCATQFNRPEQKDGLLEVFVRENAPYETAKFKLNGLDEAADYIFEDADGGEFTVSGKTLVKEGLKLTIEEKRKAKLYFYRVI